jgi:hypothetical protein
MPLRGESVGSAYVRIYADGSDVPDGIRDALRDAEPSVREAGEEHGRTYGDEFDKSVKKSYKHHFETTQGEMFDNLNDNLTDSLAKLELSDRFFKSKKWQDFKQRLEDEGGLAGRRAGQSLEEQFRDSADLNGLVEAVKRMGPRFRGAQKELLDAFDADWAKMLDTAYKENKNFDDRLRRLNAQYDMDFERHTEKLARSVSDMFDEAYRDHADFNRREKQLNFQHDEDFERSARNNESVLRRIQDAMKRVTEEIDKLSRGEKSAFSRGELTRRMSDLDRQFRIMVPHIDENRDRLRDWGDEIRKRDRELARLTPSMSRLDNVLDRGSGFIARLFGKGSRNDFLNFFGSIVGGLASVFRIFPQAIMWFQRLGQTISTTFTESMRAGNTTFEAFVAAFAEGGAAILETVATAGGALVAFAGFLAILGFALGPIIGLLSGLVGILTALAGSALFGIIGALTSFAPLVVPLIGVIGGVILAIQKFKADAGPLSDLFDHLKAPSQGVGADIRPVRLQADR